ncbi:hypothetical protein COH25_10565 [Neisseria meningitidis]|nr:hypothetical protein COH25_10565 [Neisseria meningitidis]
MPSERFSDGIFLRFPRWRRIRKRRSGWIVGWVETCRIRRICQIYRRHSYESGNLERGVKKTCIPSFPRTYIPSFPRKWESRSVGAETYRI